MTKQVAVKDNNVAAGTTKPCVKNFSLMVKTNVKAGAYSTAPRLCW